MLGHGTSGRRAACAHGYCPPDGALSPFIARFCMNGEA
ncbi:unnamed protein product [[Actinomadura] parvosata subsp. kistnae]|nr:unnamed protein product [Actinomadura parvosata subsp. kistnae]